MRYNKLVLRHVPVLSSEESEIFDLLIDRINEYHSDFIEEEFGIRQKEIPCDIIVVPGIGYVLKLDIPGVEAFMDAEDFLWDWDALDYDIEEQVLKTVHSPILRRRAMEAMRGEGRKRR